MNEILTESPLQEPREGRQGFAHRQISWDTVKGNNSRGDGKYGVILT